MRARHYSLKMGTCCDSSYNSRRPENIRARQANLDAYRKLIDEGKCLPLFEEKDDFLERRARRMRESHE